MVVPKGWLEQKQHEQDVKYWTQRFDDARNGKETWDVVYTAYIGSPLWKNKIRTPILKRANGKCEGCSAIIIDSSAFDVHHWTYDRIGGNERDEDLSALCFSCHQKADRKRERIKEQERLENYYYARLHGFARWKYGELWEMEYDEDEVEQEWLRGLYKKYCKQENEPFELDYDGRAPEWFMEMVHNDQVKFYEDFE